MSGVRRQRWFDGIAIAASSACLVHCLILPGLLVAIPATAAWLAIPESFHLGAFLFAIPTSLVALAVGFKGHGRCLPMTIAIIGLLLLGVAAVPLAETVVEIPISIFGAAALAIAHVANLQARRRVVASDT